MATRKSNITTGKYMGDDKYSYAVFRNGVPLYIGLSRTSAKYYADVEKKKVAEQRIAYAN